jgi:hypothetical protein
VNIKEMVSNPTVGSNRRISIMGWPFKPRVVDLISRSSGKNGMQVLKYPSIYESKPPHSVLKDARMILVILKKVRV